MIREIMDALALGTDSDSEALRLGVIVLEWLQMHLGWEGEALAPHFLEPIMQERWAGRLARAWYPGCSYMAGFDRSGRGCATLLVRGASAPMVVTAADPADALLLACFKVYDMRQKREAFADGIAQARA